MKIATSSDFKVLKCHFLYEKVALSLENVLKTFSVKDLMKRIIGLFSESAAKT